MRFRWFLTELLGEIHLFMVQAPRFYYFDVGLTNYLLGRNSLKRGTVEYGHAFKHLVVQEIRTRHKAGLKAFQEEHPNARLILVSLDPITRISEGKELLFVTDFFKMLWEGKIFNPLIHLFLPSSPSCFEGTRRCSIGRS